MIKEHLPSLIMTEKITNLSIEIAELTGMISLSNHIYQNSAFREVNQFQSIYSSLAFERNPLTHDQVRDIIDGKRVYGTLQDIREVQNLYEVYSIISKLNPYSIEDLIKVYNIMIHDLIILQNKEVDDLFSWLKESQQHPLIKSCIFHYQFQRIQPFTDKNRRISIIWHKLILSSWKEFYLWLPIEKILYKEQKKYAQVLNASNKEGQSTVFVEYILTIIKDTLKEWLSTELLFANPPPPML